MYIYRNLFQNIKILISLFKEKRYFDQFYIIFDQLYNI